jgi:hypothetical protein
VRPGRDRDDPGRGRGQQREDDASAGRQQHQDGAGQDGELPGLRKGAGERDGGAEDGAEGGGARPVEECARPRVHSRAVEVAAAAQDEREGRGERDRGGEQPAPDARGGVADGGHGVHDRARRDLPERHGVQVSIYCAWRLRGWGAGYCAWRLPGWGAGYCAWRLRGWGAGYCAWRLRGWGGALAGGLAFILPGLVAVLALGVVPDRDVALVGPGGRSSRSTDTMIRRQGGERCALSTRLTAHTLRADSPVQACFTSTRCGSGVAVTGTRISRIPSA